jgi:Protein of unknown function (DUF3040)
MPLSRDEQRLLDGIEKALRARDPAFAARLDFPSANRYRRRQAGVAHGCLWVGMIMALIGVGLVHQAHGAGLLLILYGFLMVALAVAAVQRLRCPTPGSPRRRLP